MTDPRFDDVVKFLRGHRPLTRTETAAQHADYLETVVRPQLEALAAEPARRGPGRPRKEAEACA